MYYNPALLIDTLDKIQVTIRSELVLLDLPRSPLSL